MSIRMDFTPPRIILENEYLELFFVADHGLELAFLKEKATGQKLVKMECVGKGSAFYARVCDEGQTEFLRAYEYEKESGLLWQVDFHLPAGSQILIAQILVINDTNEAKNMNWNWKSTASETWNSYGQEEKDNWKASVSETGMGFCVKGTPLLEIKEKILAPGEVFGFTVCYGKLELDMADLQNEYFAYACVKTAVQFTVPDKIMFEKEKECKKYLNQPCTKLLYAGSGWGALEQIRRMQKNLPLFPQQFLFPAETIGEEQQEELMTIMNI